MAAKTTRRAVLAGSAAAVGLAGSGFAENGLAGQAFAAPALPVPGEAARIRLSLDPGWRFHEGDLPVAPILDHEAAYAHAKAGNAEGAAGTDFDDSAWGSVNLPHDWALGQAFNPAANIDQGFRDRGIGWYRRSFALDPATRGSHFELQFDGVATHATVWINGTLAYRHFGGFTGFAIDLTPFATFGEDLNTLAVRVDAQATEGWWYEGAGLYRHVWLVQRDPVHIVTHGVHADPRPAAGTDALDTGWIVPVTLTLANTNDAPAPVTIEALLHDPAGHPVGRAETQVSLAASRQGEASLAIILDKPVLWSPQDPALYRLETRVWHSKRMIDAVETRIGLRTLRFDAAQGFFLNEQPLKIKGVCAHQDHAGVGVAVPDSLWDYRLRRLQVMGANALRCAHNPPAAELLDAADRLGMLIMDEHRELGASTETLDRLAWMVRRDRNHPSVILWSLCNEESIQASNIGMAMIRAMKTTVRALDTSRPITAALNGAMFAAPNIADELDVVGFNYGQAHYDRYHAAYPDRPLFSSEDTSAYMTRGAARSDLSAHCLADDDTEHAPWGQSQGEAWDAIASRPFMAGGFVWTGFDYRGEPTPFSWPSVSSFFGVMDACGFAKGAYHIRRALWREETVLELWPHWNFPGEEGKPVTILAITNAPTVELRLNGKTVAREAVQRGLARITLPYAPGRIEAVAWHGNSALAHAMRETAGPAHALRLTPDRTSLMGDGRDTVPVTVEVLDALGRTLPTASHEVRFTISGGRILGVGNGDPNSHESDCPAPGGKSATRRLFNGLAQVLVCGQEARPLNLEAHAPGLLPARAVLMPVSGGIPTLPPREGRQRLTEWRQAPASAQRPQLGQHLAEGDMNSWAWIKPGAVEPGDPALRHVLLHVTFVARPAVAQHGGSIRFAALAGAAEIWLDGRLAMTKTEPAAAPVFVPLPPGTGEHVLEVLFDSQGRNAPFGLAGTVSLTADAAPVMAIS